MPQPSIKGAILVSTCNRLHITEAFYKRLSLGEPFQHSVLPGPSKGKSFSVVLNFAYGEDNTPLISALRQFCYIDPKTRKGIPILGDHMENATEHKLIRINAEPVPARHFRYRLRVAHSDTDHLNHTNQSNYLRFCMDAAAEAVKTGALSNFTGDLFEYKLKDADLLYQAECHAGDELDVCLWEDETDTNRLHFQIAKNTHDVLFSTVTYYNRVQSNL